MLTLVMAQSVAEGIREVTGMETGNQMAERYCYDKKKVCGILTEMSTEIDYINYVGHRCRNQCQSEVFDEELKEKPPPL